jgi:tonB-dependent receptor plug
VCDVKSKTYISNRLLSAALLTGIFAASAPGISYAGDSTGSESKKIYDAGTVVVTAMRMESPDLDSPASTIVITGKELEERGENSLFEAISRVPGVTAVSYGTGGEDYIGHPLRMNVRGIDKGTLIMLNGSPINMQAQNSALSAIPVSAVERIEIVRGANSVLYGAEAMGGVINVITKKPSKTETTVGAEFGNKEKNYFVRTGDGKFSFQYKKEYRRGVDPFNRVSKKGRNYQISTKESSIKDGIFLDYAFNDKLVLHYIYNEIDSGFTIWQIPTLTDIYSGRSPETRYRQTRNQHDANLIYDDADREFKVSLNYLNDKMDYTKHAKANAGVWKDTKKLVRGEGYALDIQKGWWVGDRSHLIAGTTWQREKYLSRDTTEKSLRRDQYALFLSYSIDFDDRFAMTIGAREHFVKKNVYEKAQNVFLPQFQLNYKLNPTSSLYANVGKSFVMPSITTPSSSSSWANLRPQTGWTYEAGYKHITSTEGFRATFFHMDIKDKFEWTKENLLIPGGDPNVSVLVNRSKFRNTGLELEYTKKLGKYWHLRYSASISKPESKDEGGNWAQDTSRFQTGTDLTYEKDRFLANASLFYMGNREAPYYRSDGEYTSKKGVDHRLGNVLQFNMNFRYQMTDRDVLTLGIYNILDRKNPVNKYEYPEMPRNFRLGYSHTF